MRERTFQKMSITHEATQRIVAAAEAKAREIGVPMSIAVTDESGTLKAFSRMDGASLSSVHIAQDKAYSAISFGMSTDAWYDLIKDDPPLLHGIIKVERLIIFGGGYPLTDEESIVGAIGVSGGHYTQDIQVAQAGREAREASTERGHQE